MCKPCLFSDAMPMALFDSDAMTQSNYKFPSELESFSDSMSESSFDQDDDMSYSEGESDFLEEIDDDLPRQATKVLKVVTNDNYQAHELLLRQHERLEARITAFDDELAALKNSAIANVINQSKRRAQVAQIGADVELAQSLGNVNMVEDLAAELKALQDEGKRQADTFEQLKEAIRSTKRAKREAQMDKLEAEDRLRNFHKKQWIVEQLLKTCEDEAASTDDSSDECSSYDGSSVDGDIEFNPEDFATDDEEEEDEFPMDGAESSVFSSEVSAMYSSDLGLSEGGRKPSFGNKSRLRRSRSVSFAMDSCNVVPSETQLLPIMA